MQNLRYIAILFLALAMFTSSCSMVGTMTKKNMTDFVTKQGGTEEAFDNEYWDEKRPGIYTDVNTGEPLFLSLDKFDSGTGWPSFTRTINEAVIQKKEDNSLGMPRIEVRTNASHLGHVFDDGPEGQPRFCINSAALKFIPYDELGSEGYGEYKELFPYDEALFAGGCFWGVEHLFEQVEGVIEAVSGYTGGNQEDPDYGRVSTGLSGHAESVLVIYDPSIVSYEDLLGLFWRMHDPTQVDRQGPDVGSQYRSAIFYADDEQRLAAEMSKADFDAKKVFDKPAATQIIQAGKFYRAEEYHQDYVDNNPGYVCHALRDK